MDPFVKKILIEAAPKTSNATIINNKYPKLLELVKNGLSIEQACVKLNIAMNYLATYLTQEQKQELQQAKKNTNVKIKSEKKEINWDEIFNKVYDLVSKNGLTISKALLNVGIVSSHKFYANITNEQKNELKIAAVSKSGFNGRSKIKGGNQYDLSISDYDDTFEEY